ncbi:hypothetical protein KKA15_00415 [Patescibacteria group bacterium]|nr:hypothetical protein [Patescibacteria group bacterium]
MIKQEINYKKCLIITIVFLIVAVLIKYGLNYVTYGRFGIPNTISDFALFGVYFLVQSFFMTLVVILFRDKLDDSKWKAGILIGFLVWLFTSASALAFSELSALFLLLPTDFNPKPALIFAEAIKHIVILAGHIIIGIIFVALIDRMYYKK